MILLLTYYSCCDNGTEFRGYVKQVCSENNVRMIRGRAYHPQSQGSIEIANRTFKKRLRAHMTSTGRRDWANLLDDVSFPINTTSSAALPRHKTPYDVWFARPRRWIHTEQLENDETEIEDNEEEDAIDEVEAEDDEPGDRWQLSVLHIGPSQTASAAAEAAEPVEAEEAAEEAIEEQGMDGFEWIDSELAEDEDDADGLQEFFTGDEGENENESEEDRSCAVSLTAVETQVAENNLRLHQAMRAKGAATAKTFSAQELATLFIPLKLRLKAEETRLVVRVVDENAGGYKLLTKHGLLKGRHQGSELNKLSEVHVNLLRDGIPAELPRTDRGKLIVKSLAEAVSLENNRPSIAQMQKRGRKQKAPQRQSSRPKRPTAKLRQAGEPSTAPASAVVAAPTPAPAAPYRLNPRSAATRAATAIQELSSAMPIPPQRRRKHQ